MARLTDPRGITLIGEPTPVQFCGFFTNTYILGRFGWDLATDDNYRDPFGKNAVLHNKKLGLSLFGIVHGMDELRQDRVGRAFGFRQRDDQRDWGAGASNVDRQSDAWFRARDEGRPHIEIQRAGMPNSHMLRMPEMRESMSWRDTDPHYAEGSMGELHRLPLFAELYAPAPDTQDLIVEPADVQALLDQILAAQGPMRREIRARDKRRDRDSAPAAPRQVHAQIVSLHAA